MTPHLERAFRVAIFDQFLDSFSRVPAGEQRSVMDFVRRFRADPTVFAYQPIQDALDAGLHTAEVDHRWRAVVLNPAGGHVYVLLWVALQEEADRWGRDKRCEVHPETGSLQILALGEAPPAPVDAPPDAPAPLFAAFSDEDLLSVGVPAVLLPRVRALYAPEDLATAAPELPADAHEALFFLADGESVAEVRRAMGIEEGPRAAPADIAEALETDQSRRSFVVVDSDEALAAMLDAPLERWRVFLHPSQRRLVERHWSGPVRVLGGAGTGKTVVAMHRAAWLVQQRYPADDERILFTTFTRNLAADIAANLRTICPPRAFRRIEVEHLDRWTSNFLHQHGYPYQIDYWQRGSGRLWDLWMRAMTLAPLGFPETFFREEWDYVVQPRGCRALEDYLSVGRAGRGRRLTRAQRRALWPVFAEYRNLLDAARLKERGDAMEDAAGLLQRREAILPYRAIVVDEAQDMSTTAFRLLRAMVPAGDDDLFIVGDAHQRIYSRRVVLRDAGVHVVGRARRLRVNYRTTEEIRRFAVAILEDLPFDDLDDGLDTTRGYRSLLRGPPPRVGGFPTFDEEVEAIAAFVAEGEAARTCLVARTVALLDRYAVVLNARGLPTYRLRRSQAEDRGVSGLRLATLHRVKGLEFDRVVLAGANDGVIPLREAFADTEDPAVHEDVERQERSLLHVALTRARREVMVSWWGAGSGWLTGARRS